LEGKLSTDLDAQVPVPQDDVPVTDPLGERAAVVSAAELAV
jgi:hypothetical protein